MYLGNVQRDYIDVAQMHVECCIKKKAQKEHVIEAFRSEYLVALRLEC